LHTKGFRGEALASIAAIAHVEMKTKQDQEELGTQIIVEGSVCIPRHAVLPKGTRFKISFQYSSTS
jgi:DNA mismatch repair protein MutL